MTWLARHLDKIGIGGALFAALCCLGFPALLAVISTVGLGFLINDAVLIPLLAAFLAVALVGLALGARLHRSPWALILGALSAAMTIAAIAVSPNGVVAGIGVAGLIAASALNVWLRMRQMRVMGSASDPSSG